MVQQMDNLGRVERELQRLRQRIDGSLARIEELRAIQLQFADLSQERDRIRVYFDHLQKEWPVIRNEWGHIREDVNTALRQMKETESCLSDLWLETQEAVNHAIRSLDQRFKQAISDIKSHNEQHRQTLQEELLRVQNHLHTAHRNLRVEVGNQINDIRGDIEQRFAAFHSEWDRQHQAILSRLDQLRSAMESETQTLASQLETVTDRVLALDARVDRLNRRSQTMQRLFAAILALVVVVSIFSIWAVVSS